MGRKPVHLFDLEFLAVLLSFQGEENFMKIIGNSGEDKDPLKEKQSLGSGAF